MSSAPTIKTAADLLNARDICRGELVRGQFVRRDWAGALQGCVANLVGYALSRHSELAGGGAVFASGTGFLLAEDPDTVRAPDVAFVKASRLHLIPERGFFPGAPDLAVEVLSPHDAAGEVLAKVSDWLSTGAAAVWVVDPDRRTVAIYQSGAAVRTLTDADEFHDEAFLPGFRVKVASFFPS